MAMNVMEMVSGARVNGAAVHCLLLTRELARRGHQVTVVCPPGAWITTAMQSPAVEIVESDLHRWPVDELRRVATIARDRRIDVLHTHMSRAHFFGVLLRWFSGLPSVATAHSRHLQLHWMFNDRVIAVSEATRRFHRAYNFVPRRRMAVIHNFVDCGRFSQVPAAARAALRASLGIDGVAPLIGTIGDVVPQKGLMHLVRAWPHIRAAVPEARLLVVGEGPDGYMAQVKSAAAQLGVASSILWAGLRTDVPEVVAALDLFVSASLVENLPLSVLEAMAGGLPVVATAVGGVPECVSAGETGMLVPPGDSAALAAAITALLRDAGLRRTFGEAARQRVRERFSVETQVPQIEAVLASATRRDQQ